MSVCVRVCVCVCVYLVSLLAARDGAGEGLLVASIHAHGAEDGLRADGALRRPRLALVPPSKVTSHLATVRPLKCPPRLVILTPCRATHTHRSVHTRTHTHTHTQTPTHTQHP